MSSSTKTRHPAVSFIFDILETVVISMAILLIVYIFFVQPHQVDGHSMDPTLQDGEYLLTNKISYRFGDPQRSDIVVFRAPKEACFGGNCDFIKRVIALPGETIEYRAGRIYINGEPLQETYLSPTVATNTAAYLSENRPVTLKEDEYFVMGDNRPHSSDSRLWGPVTKKDIIGKAFFSYWPTQTFGLIKDQVYDLPELLEFETSGPTAEFEAASVAPMATSNALY